MAATVSNSIAVLKIASPGLSAASGLSVTLSVPRATLRSLIVRAAPAPPAPPARPYRTLQQPDSGVPPLPRR